MKTQASAVNQLLPAIDEATTTNDSRVNSLVTPRAIRNSDPLSRIEQGNSTLGSNLFRPNSYALVMKRTLTFGSSIRLTIVSISTTQEIDVFPSWD